MNNQQNSVKGQQINLLACSRTNEYFYRVRTIFVMCALALLYSALSIPNSFASSDCQRCWVGSQTTLDMMRKYASRARGENRSIGGATASQWEAKIQRTLGRISECCGPVPFKNECEARLRAAEQTHLCTIPQPETENPNISEPSPEPPLDEEENPSTGPSPIENEDPVVEPLPREIKAPAPEPPSFENVSRKPNIDRDPGDGLGGRAHPQNPGLPQPVVSQACSDSELILIYGVPSVSSERNNLDSFDDAITNAVFGHRLKEAILDTATEFNVNPHDLFINAVAESHPTTYIRRTGVQSHEIGLDYWATLGPRVRRNVPGADSIRSRGVGEYFENELGIPTGEIHEFENGRVALRALSATLAFFRPIHQRWVDTQFGGDYDNFHPSIKTAAFRIHLNAGNGAARRFLRNAARGQNPFITEGTISTRHPARTATVRTAQALHVAREFFNGDTNCYE